MGVCIYSEKQMQCTNLFTQIKEEQRIQPELVSHREDQHLGAGGHGAGVTWWSWDLEEPAHWELELVDTGRCAN